MQNMANDIIKIIIAMLLVALAIGALGATALSLGELIAGATCFIVVGFMLGILFGYFVASIDEDGDEDDLLR